LADATSLKGPVLKLKPGREKSLRHRHPWVYSGAIETVQGEPASGDTVSVIAADGTMLGRAAYSPSSQIRARVWSFDPRMPIDAAFFRHRIDRAVAARVAMQDDRHTGCRLVHAESDGLPGVVADRYGEVVVVQLSSAGAEQWRDAIVDVAAGQKTGFYLDQRDNRRAIRALAAGRDTLNVFCYSGGFTLAALAGGASRVTSLDSSEAALGEARANLAANLQLDAARAEWLEADAFATLRKFRDAARSFDLIVVDPPKFAPTAAHAERASRAYKDVNLWALKLLRPGGLLATFSCSHGIDAEFFRKIVAGAALDAGADAAVVGRFGPSADHPVALAFPEGDYLKGLLIRKAAGGVP
jgi:23S rRNA (cytosine1962-C5)-methyltransferase